MEGSATNEQLVSQAISAAEAKKPIIAVFLHKPLELCTH